MAELRPPRILFLGHSASRNGASILLLHFLRWLKPRVDWDLEVIVNGRGPLLDEFRQVARTTVFRSPAAALASIPFEGRKAVQRYIDRQCMRVLLSGRRFDLLYANTAATWPQVEMLAKRAPAVLWHIHEMEYALRLSMGTDRVPQCLSAATRLVAVSRAVQDTLTHAFDVAPDKVELVHGFIPLATLDDEDRRVRRARVRRELGWPQDAFVVGGCGSTGWRKGTDLFVQVARILSEATGGEGMRFLWVGGQPGEQDTLAFAQDVRAMGLQQRCALVPTTPQVSDFYCAMDAFALTSREDPFPLVMLEAAAHGLPIVCFAGSGGGPEFTANEAGLIAPYANAAEFAARIKALLDDRGLCRRLGNAASTKVREKHGLETQGPLLLRSMQRCLTAQQASGAGALHARPQTPIQGK